MKPRPGRQKSAFPLWVVLFVAGIVVVVGIFFWKKVGSGKLGTAGLASRSAASIEAEDAKTVRTLVTAEETCLTLNRQMSVLSKNLMNLRLPFDADGTSVFAQSVRVMDLGPAQAAMPANNNRLESRTWPLASSVKDISAVNIWRPLLDGVSWFEHADVYVTTGEHPGGDMYKFEAIAGFDALAKMQSGDWRSFRGKMLLTWKRSQNAEGEAAPPWQISGWETREMQWIGSSELLFVETLDSAIRPPRDVATLRKSLHQEATVKFYREGMKKPPHPYFAPISANQKEGLAVADVDGDGFDDIYICVRIGKNMFLHNNGDGTFTEESAKYGLDLPGHTMCALFADFDNDGDLDLILGRSLLKSSYLENRGGRFYQPPIPNYMPMAAISMAAADYNNDGLLDVYICTYRPAAPVGSSPGGGVVDDGGFDWPDEFMAPDAAREYKRRVAEHRSRKGGTVLDQLGPPNVLLVNRGGGKFEVAPENNVVGVWRNSLQATWADINEDGRPDLYIANDWGLDVLFRNDGPAGFTDVSSEMGVTSYGFAMGATFGDYDNDGREDLYVSNMYSEPGRRMTTKTPGIDKMFIESAQGNYLYHKEANGRFKQVAGMAPPAMMVMDAGWSWGGHFADFDNDTFLDLYVLSGYFTAPKELSSDLDIESNLWRMMLRTDENLSRQSFRHSPEWKRTPPPDNLGPQIDARLSGSERQGEKVLVHSLNGNERNHYFLNNSGKAFQDISAISGLDNAGDSRGFVTLDYDRDGWQDVAVVNANNPLFSLYHNEMAAAGRNGGMIAIQFVGGNQAAAASKEFACRDGYGARVNLDLGDTKLTREHRCGDGWATQNSPTMIVGIGAHKNVLTLLVKWPSGKTASTKDIPEGTLLTVYENAADSPTREAFTRRPYRMKKEAAPISIAQRPLFPLRAADGAAKPARLHIYTTFATSSLECQKYISSLKELKQQLGSDVDLVAAPIDAQEDIAGLAQYSQENPAVRFIMVAPQSRTNVYALFKKAIAEEPTLPSTVVTDDAGHIVSTQTGAPSLSDLRRLIAQSKETGTVTSQ